MADLRAARRYASALFAVAVRQNALEAVESDLRAVVDLWKQSPQIAAVMDRPQLPPDVKQRIWRQLLEGSVSALTVRFIDLLVEKRRIGMLPEVDAEFERLSDRHRNVVRAHVTTAVPLARDLADALKRRLAGPSGGTVNLTETVDPAILGGAVVRVGDRIMDGSTRTQLETLRRRLAGVR